MPEPPKFAPLDASLPTVEPSVSQYSVAPRAVPPNSQSASMAESTSAAFRSALAVCRSWMISP
jgi:hypothetical protein